MELPWLYTSLSVLLIVLAIKLLSKARHRNLPPSPLALPVIGHLHLLKQPLHRTLHNLSQKYGPIMSLQFGTRRIVVVSSSSAAEECFTKNDIVLANRPHFLVSKYVGYNYTNMVDAPYGDHWRNLRRLSTLEIFSTLRLNAFLSIRKDEIKLLLNSLYQKSSNEFAKVEMKSKLSELSFNIIMRMVADKRYYGEDVAAADYEEAKHFRDLIMEVFEYSGVTNAGDFLPVLRWVDYQNVKKNLVRLGKKMDAFLQGLIDEHRCSEGKNTMIDHLLSLQKLQPQYYTDQMIKGLVMNMLFAGTDTSSVTIEWAMSHLLNNPEVLKKARIELDTYVGENRLVDEPDLTNLKYLQNIISETLRLCPAAPLLLPHMSSNDCTIGGYNVPGGTIVLANAWGIHRDPMIWDDATEFKPERFEVGEVEAHKLMPFGMGRRSCPGSGLAQRVVGLTLGSLIQCFEWERESEKLVDLREGKGITMPKAEPLECMCKAREIMKKVVVLVPEATG